MAVDLNALTNEQMNTWVKNNMPSIEDEYKDVISPGILGLAMYENDAKSNGAILMATTIPVIGYVYTAGSPIKLNDSFSFTEDGWYYTYDTQNAATFEKLTDKITVTLMEGITTGAVTTIDPAFEELNGIAFAAVEGGNLGEFTVGQTIGVGDKFIFNTKTNPLTWLQSLTYDDGVCILAQSRNDSGELSDPIILAEHEDTRYSIIAIYGAGEKACGWSNEASESSDIPNAGWYNVGEDGTTTIELDTNPQIGLPNDDNLWNGLFIGFQKKS